MGIRLGDPPQPLHTWPLARCCSTPVFSPRCHSLSGLRIVRRAGLANLRLRGSYAYPCRTCRQHRVQARCCVSLCAKCLRGTGMHATASHKCLRGAVTCNAAPAGAACGEARSKIASVAEGAHDYTHCTRYCLPWCLRGAGTLWRRPSCALCTHRDACSALMVVQLLPSHTSPRCTV